MKNDKTIRKILIYLSGLWLLFISSAISVNLYKIFILREHISNVNKWSKYLADHNLPEYKIAISLLLINKLFICLIVPIVIIWTLFLIVKRIKR